MQTRSRATKPIPRTNRRRTMKLNLSNSIDRNKAETYLKKLVEKGAKIELKEFKPKRSLSQNNYFHVCCAILSDFSGYTIDEMKIIIKDQLEFMNYTKNGHKFYRSTADRDWETIVYPEKSLRIAQQTWK